MTANRFYEIIPGALAWLTFLLIFLLSWQAPVFAAVFIIFFDVYWLLKSVYLSMHLQATFRQMKTNLKTDWLARLRTEQPLARLSGGTCAWEEIYHLIILPMYEEPLALLRESFASLTRVNYPREKFILVLATEERAGEKAREAARQIEAEFGNKFFKFLVTTHPAGLPGELAGKGSNETWAARQVEEKIIRPLNLPPEKILVSVFDVDTQVFPEYFSRLTYVFLRAANPLRSIYQPIPLFTNNIYETPALARIVAFTTTFWQMMQQSRPERLTTFSSQSLPFRVLQDIGFWHTHVVSEDSRIFWQGYLHYHGDFRVEPLNYPVSMDANTTPSFWTTMKNVYKQHRRWAWGSENVPYMLDGFRRDPKIPRGKKWYWAFNTIEGFHSWATNALMIFALGWLPLWLGGKSFNATVLSYNLPQLTRLIIDLSMIGIATSAAIGVFLLPAKPKWFRPWHYLLYILQWALLPVTLIIFGAFPAVDAQTRLALGGKWRLGFWVTPKHRSEIVRK